MRAQILNASAGSGKTYQLAYKYVRDVVEQPFLYRHILAVTFTNKATEEMKTRILKEINTLASGAESSYMENLCRELDLDQPTVRRRAKTALRKILHDYSHFTILTIDTFFQRILRAFIKELGIELNYNIELESSSVLNRSIDKLIEDITTDKELRKWLMAFVQESIDDGKKWDVRGTIATLGKELFKEKNKDILSAAKSKDELNKIVNDATAKCKAYEKQMQQLAQSALSLMDGEAVRYDDFPGKSRSFAKYFVTIASGEIKKYTDTVNKARHDLDKWGKVGSSSRTIAPQLQPLLQQMCDIYDTASTFWNTTSLIRENYRSYALLADLYSKVEEICDKENTMILSETKYIVSEFIGNNDAPFIYEKVGNRYDHFMIDEFQDTSTKEWENFLPLLQNAMSQKEETSVLIVGDIKQSIYRWRGGDWRLLHSQAQQSLGEDSTEVINLKDNYRSLPNIVRFNNNIIERVVERDNGLLNTTLSDATAQGYITENGEESLKDMLSNAYKEHKQNPRKKGDCEGYINITTFKEEPPIIERIKQLIDNGYKPFEIMILTRGKRDIRKVADTLLEFKSTNQEPKYNFDIMTQEALIIGYAPIATFIISTLRLALNLDDTISRALFNQFLGDRDYQTPLTQEDTIFLRAIRLLSPEEAFERIVINYKLDNNSPQIAYLQAIHEQIISFCSTKVADISLFVKWWEEVGRNRSLNVKQSQTTIEISTIHKAKGLEKRVILIPYCTWQLQPLSAGNISNFVWSKADGDEFGGIGNMPIKYKKSMSESLFSIDYYREMVYSHVDNINILYVALTRAVESLHIFIGQGSKATVGKHIIESIASADGDRVAIGDLEGRMTTTEQGEVYEFGEFTAAKSIEKSASSTDSYKLTNYPTANTEMKLRLPSKRYFEDSKTVELSPRNFGILMHKVFEKSSTIHEIQITIEQMIANGEVDKDSVVTLRKMVDEALAMPQVKRWFSSDWTTIRKENDIIIPRSKWMRRPDRVMISDQEVVVVDYKFGDEELPKYHNQIRDYIALLSQIGYQNINGYIWYVKLGKVVEVEMATLF